MFRTLMAGILAASIWLLCSTQKGQAVDPCTKCNCKVVKAWSAQATNNPVYGLREMDKNAPKNTVVVTHVPLAGALQIVTATCDTGTVQKTGNYYTKYEYSSGTITCSKNPGAAAVEMEATDWDDFSSTKDSIERRNCDGPANPPDDG